MGSQELARLLNSAAAVQAVMAAIESPALAQARGWDLANWTYRATPGSICFIEHDGQGQAREVIVAVWAAEERRERIARVLTSFPLPVRLIMLGAAAALPKGSSP